MLKIIYRQDGELVSDHGLEKWAKDILRRHKIFKSLKVYVACEMAVFPLIVAGKIAEKQPVIALPHIATKFTKKNAETIAEQVRNLGGFAGKAKVVLWKEQTIISIDRFIKTIKLLEGNK